MVRGGLLVEFLGLPGVGKSTISHQVAEILRKEGISVAEPTYVLAHKTRTHTRILKKSAHAIWGTLCRPSRACLLASVVVASRQRSIGDSARTLFNCLFLSSLMRRCEQAGGIYLFDQGMFQALWSIGFHADDRAFVNSLHKLCNVILLPAVIVLVEAPVESIKQRLTGRIGFASRLEKQDMDDTFSWERAVSVLEGIKGILYSRAQCRSVHLLCMDNALEKDAALHVGEIAKKLEQICKDERIEKDA